MEIGNLLEGNKKRLEKFLIELGCIYRIVEIKN